MKDVFFWKDWERPYKITINILLGTFALCLVALAIGFFFGEDFVIRPTNDNVPEKINRRVEIHVKAER